MLKYINFIKKISNSFNDKLKVGFNALNKKEVILVYSLTLVSIISLFAILSKVNANFTEQVPEDGGSLTEGIVGIPTLINPVLAVSPADKDMEALVYSGLMRKDVGGELIPDIAESYKISPDGRKYTFNIKEGLKFHDGVNITADDVVFTITKIQDPLIKSPRSINWQGVEVLKEDETTVSFILKQPYASFLDNTTIGILPMHIWKKVSPAEFGLSNLNIKAIGSGPYMIKSVVKDSEGVPKYYKLESFSKFSLSKPHINNFSIISYPNEKELIADLRNGNIDQAGGISPESAYKLSEKNIKIETSVLPRMFGIFFNSNENKVLGDKQVLKAINLALNKEKIVSEVLYGYGKVIDNPVPNQFIKNNTEISGDSQKDISNIESAKKILENSGYVMGTDGIYAKGKFKTITTGKGKNKKTVKVADGKGESIHFSITTGDTPELRKSAELIKDDLRKLGIDVELKIYETGQLNQVIRERNYEALFFGEVVNHESDLFAYWHSSQKKDPGLNIALYENKAVDAILETAQQTLREEDRSKKYLQFINIWESDIPAIFIYSPEYIYASNNNIKHFNGLLITTPQDRFSTINTWYKNTDNVWKIFTN